MDAVFKALADESRRELLSDRLRADNGQETLNELCVRLDMTRQAVSKHLAILEAAGISSPPCGGAGSKLHYLNPVPIHEIGERWIGEIRKGAPAGPQRHEESPGRRGRRITMSTPKFVYVTYIRTTPESCGWR